MNKGKVFILLTVVLVIVVFYFLLFEYERPPQDTGSTSSTTGPTRTPTECELNTTCFIRAIKNDCHPAYFLLPHPINDTRYLEGEILESLFNQCEVLVKDSKTGKSMTCLIGPSTLEGVDSFRELLNSCSGDLIGELTPIE